MEKRYRVRNTMHHAFLTLPEEEEAMACLLKCECGFTEQEACEWGMEIRYYPERVYLGSSHFSRTGKVFFTTARLDTEPPDRDNPTT